MSPSTLACAELGRHGLGGGPYGAQPVAATVSTYPRKKLYPRHDSRAKKIEASDERLASRPSPTRTTPATTRRSLSGEGNRRPHFGSSFEYEKGLRRGKGRVPRRLKARRRAERRRSEDCWRRQGRLPTYNSGGYLTEMALL